MDGIVRFRAKSLLVLVVVWVCFFPLSAATQITFERAYGGVSFDQGRCVRQTQDGGYIITGGARSFGNGWYDVYLVKTDSLGDSLWTRTYGGVSEDYGFSVKQAEDGGYIIAGYTTPSGPESCDIYLIKTDSSGDSVWTRTYDGGLTEFGYSIEQTLDGGYIVVGRTGPFLGSSDIYLIKTDSLGDTLWTRTHGGVYSFDAYSVQQTLDGGYIIAGGEGVFFSEDYDVYLLKTDPLGDSVWARTYGGVDSVDSDVGRSVQQTLDGGYIITGSTSSFGAGSYDVYLIKTDSMGDSLWTRTYGGVSEDHGYSVEQTQDGGYIIAGWTGPSWSYDACLIKTDSLGNNVWMRSYGGMEHDNGWCVQQTQDGGYVMVGQTESFGAGYEDVYLIKTDQNGLTGAQEESPSINTLRSTMVLLQNHPNPFHHSTLILYSLPVNSEVTLSICDITGRVVETLVNETQQPGIHQVRWDRRANPSGVYFYRLEAGESVETRKMVVIN